MTLKYPLQAHKFSVHFDKDIINMIDLIIRCKLDIHNRLIDLTIRQPDDTKLPHAFFLINKVLDKSNNIQVVIGNNTEEIILEDIKKISHKFGDLDYSNGEIVNHNVTFSFKNLV